MTDVLFKTLHGKLSVILLGLLCLVGCFSIPLTLFTTQRYQQEVSQHLNRPLAASLTAHLAAKNLLSPDPAVLQKARSEIKYLMVINPNIDVYLLDAQGTILASSGSPEEIRRSRVSLTPLHRFLRGAAPLPLLGDDPRAARGQKIFSAASFPVKRRPISGQTQSDVSQGYVYVTLNDGPSASVAGLLGKSYVLRSGVWAIAVVLALASVAGLLLFRLLTRRLRRLTAAIETFQNRSYREPEALLPVDLLSLRPDAATSGDEIDRLGTVYFQMSQRIQGQIQELAQADAHRREMVSNVSHDLRTPLAALHGYLETLLMKEGRLTPVEQRNYLQIALRHTERLAKLVGELFELARLDAREVQVHLEPFLLGELVQDVVQQYNLASQQKKLRLQCLLSGDLPMVYADIALIERVLHNLLENAMRYTPEGGSITLSLTPQAGSIEVRITDTGIGIPQEDLPHIFERFYRVPSQPDQAGCAGLGLAITRRILELHHSAIVVESVPDQGTSFAFHLATHTPPGVSQTA